MLTFDRFLRQFDVDGTNTSSIADVHHPARYQGASALGRPLLLELGLTYKDLDLECITFIEQKNLNFSEASLVKYLWRLGEKGGAASCLNKAKWYAVRQMYNQVVNVGRVRQILWFLGIGKPAFEFQNLRSLVSLIDYQLRSDAN